MHAATDHLDVVFRALGDPVRRRIIERLARGPATVSELAEPFDISAPAITRHLKVLEQAGMLVRHKDGRVHHCRLDPAPMATASNWIEFHRRFWQQQFSQLDEFLHDTRPDADPTAPDPTPPPSQTTQPDDLPQSDSPQPPRPAPHTGRANRTRRRKNDP